MGVLGQRHRPPAAPPPPPPGRQHRTHGPLFLSERRPVSARRPAAADICPHTGRARLGYDRARVLLDTYAGLDLHQLRHSAATHLGEAEIPLQLIMGKTRHKNPRAAMRYVKPGNGVLIVRDARVSPGRPCSLGVATAPAGCVTAVLICGFGQAGRRPWTVLPWGCTRALRGVNVDPIVLAAGTALVTAMASDGWQAARAGAVALWRKVRPEQADAVEAELVEVREQVLEARRDGDTGIEQVLAVEWQSKLQRLVRNDPMLAMQMQRLLDVHLLPLLAAEEQTRIHSIIQSAEASGHSTIYQAGGNITTHQPPTS